MGVGAGLYMYVVVVGNSADKTDTQLLEATRHRASTEHSLTFRVRAML